MAGIGLPAVVGTPAEGPVVCTDSCPALLAKLVDCICKSSVIDSSTQEQSWYQNQWKQQTWHQHRRRLLRLAYSHVLDLHEDAYPTVEDRQETNALDLASVYLQLQARFGREGDRLQDLLSRLSSARHIQVYESTQQVLADWERPVLRLTEHDKLTSLLLVITGTAPQQDTAGLLRARGPPLSLLSSTQPKQPSTAHQELHTTLPSQKAATAAPGTDLTPVTDQSIILPTGSVQLAGWYPFTDDTLAVGDPCSQQPNTALCLKQVYDHQEELGIAAPSVGLEESTAAVLAASYANLGRGLTAMCHLPDMSNLLYKPTLGAEGGDATCRLTVGPWTHPSSESKAADEGAQGAGYYQQLTRESALTGAAPDPVGGSFMASLHPFVLDMDAAPGSLFGLGTGYEESVLTGGGGGGSLAQVTGASGVWDPPHDALAMSLPPPAWPEQPPFDDPHHHHSPALTSPLSSFNPGWADQQYVQPRQDVLLLGNPLPPESTQATEQGGAGGGPYPAPHWARHRPGAPGAGLHHVHLHAAHQAAAAAPVPSSDAEVVQLGILALRGTASAMIMLCDGAVRSSSSRMAAQQSLIQRLRQGAEARLRLEAFLVHHHQPGLQPTTPSTCSHAPSTPQHDTTSLVSTAIITAFLCQVRQLLNDNDQLLQDMEDVLVKGRATSSPASSPAAGLDEPAAGGGSQQQEELVVSQPTLVQLVLQVDQLMDQLSMLAALCNCLPVHEARQGVSAAAGGEEPGAGAGWCGHEADWAASRAYPLLLLLHGSRAQGGLGRPVSQWMVHGFVSGQDLLCSLFTGLLQTDSLMLEVLFTAAAGPFLHTLRSWMYTSHTDEQALKQEGLTHMMRLPAFCQHVAHEAQQAGQQQRLLALLKPQIGNIADRFSHVWHTETDPYLVWGAGGRLSGAAPGTPRSGAAGAAGGCLLLTDPSTLQLVSDAVDKAGVACWREANRVLDLLTRRRAAAAAAQDMQALARAQEYESQQEAARQAREDAALRQRRTKSEMLSQQQLAIRQAAAARTAQRLEEQDQEQHLLLLAALSDHAKASAELQAELRKGGVGAEAGAVQVSGATVQAARHALTDLAATKQLPDTSVKLSQQVARSQWRVDRLAGSAAREEVWRAQQDRDEQELQQVVSAGQQGLEVEQQQQQSATHSVTTVTNTSTTPGAQQHVSLPGTTTEATAGAEQALRGDSRVGTGGSGVQQGAAVTVRSGSGSGAGAARPMSPGAYAAALIAARPAAGLPSRRVKPASPPPAQPQSKAGALPGPALSSSPPAGQPFKLPHRRRWQVDAGGALSSPAALGSAWLSPAAGVLGAGSHDGPLPWEQVDAVQHWEDVLPEGSRHREAAPVSSVIEVCVSLPVLAAYRLTTCATWRVLMEELRLMDLCLTLRRFFFLEAGDFAQQLQDNLLSCWQVVGRSSDSSTAGQQACWGLPASQIRSALHRAAASCPAHSSDPYADNISARPACGADVFRQQGDSSHVAGSDVVVAHTAQRYGVGPGGVGDAISLQFCVPWPYNHVLCGTDADTSVAAPRQGSPAPDDYTRISRALLRLRVCAAALQQGWLAVGKPSAMAHLLLPSSAHADEGEGTAAALSQRLAKLRSWVYEALHFVNAVLRHTARMLQGTCWQQFQRAMEAGPLDMTQMSACHQQYLLHACEACFLTDHTRPSTSTVSSVLQGVVVAAVEHCEMLAGLVLAFADAISGTSWHVQGSHSLGSAPPDASDATLSPGQLYPLLKTTHQQFRSSSLNLYKLLKHGEAEQLAAGGPGGRMTDQQVTISASLLAELDCDWCARMVAANGRRRN